MIAGARQGELSAELRVHRLALAPLAAYVRGARAVPVAAGRKAPDPFAALPAFLDTLIPPDGGPSATALGVDRALLEAADARELRVHLVGGPVRDLLLERPVRDVDLVVVDLSIGDGERSGEEVIASLHALDAETGEGVWTNSGRRLAFLMTCSKDMCVWSPRAP